MTPQKYIGQLRKLIGAGQDRAALDFSARYSRDVSPNLSDADLDRVCGMLEGAAMAVSMEPPITLHREADPVSSRPTIP